MTNTTHRRSLLRRRCMWRGVECEEWLLTMSVGTEAPRQRARVRPGDRRGAEAGVGGDEDAVGAGGGCAGAELLEAGRDGFWPDRWLTRLGVVNLVVDSSSIEVSRRGGRRRPTIGRGEAAAVTAAALGWRTGDVAGGARASREAEDARHASRGADDAAGGAHAISQSDRGLLALHGVRRRADRCAVSGAAGRGTRLGGGAAAAGVEARLRRRGACWQRVETERSGRGAGAAAGARDARRPRRRSAGAGAGSRGAERDDPGRGTVQSRSAQPPRSGRVDGLVSARTQWDDVQGPGAGAQRAAGGATHRGGDRVGVAAVSTTSALAQWYHARFGGGGAVTRRIGIVALARRVIIALWRYVEHGIVPEGALLKA